MASTLPQKPALAAAAVLSFTLLTACAVEGGSIGDPPSEPEANALGDCPTIRDVLQNPTWYQPNNESNAGCDFPVDQHVCVSGVTIVAIDKYDETGEGDVGNFYVEDTRAVPLTRTGMTVYRPSFSPPDLRLGKGDVVDLLGTYMEFSGPGTFPFGECRTLAEIGGTMSLRFEGGGVTPLLIPLSELYSYESAREYVGMLVRLENVTIVDEPSSSGGRYLAPLKVDMAIAADAVPKLSNELFALQDMGFKEGTKLRAVTGVVTYFFGFKIAPRSAEDIEL